MTWGLASCPHVGTSDRSRAPAHFQGQKYREYRCGGQLVKGKRCRDYEYLRGQE